MLLYEAYQQVGISIASLAYYCGPVIVMILSPFLFRETLTWPKIAVFLTVLAGMCLVNLQALDEGKTIWGLFCGLMSAFMYALMVTANKKPNLNPVWKILCCNLSSALLSSSHLSVCRKTLFCH